MASDETGVQEEILGKVARVISDTEVVMNIGREDGVQINEIAEVFRRFPITDPDRPGTKLGDVDRTLVRVRIFEVYDNMAVGRTFQSVTRQQDPYNMIDRFVFTGLPKTVPIRVSESTSAYDIVQLERGDLVRIKRETNES